MSDALVIKDPEEAQKYGACGATTYGGFMNGDALCGKPNGHKGMHRGYVLDWPNGYCSVNWGSKERREEQKAIYASESKAGNTTESKEQA